MTSAELEALGEEIATFAARVDAATHALLTRLRVYDAHEAWGGTGALSCAHWLSWRIGVGAQAAREKVRVARALGDLPKVDELFGRGELSYSKVRAITRVATRETEEEFIDLALHSTAAQLERLLRAYKRCRELNEGPGDVPSDQRRFVRRYETRSGMVRLEMQLPPEEAALVWEAITAAGDRDDDDSAEAPPLTEGATVEAPGDSVPVPVDACAETSPGLPANDGEEVEQRRADAIVDVARAYLQHRPRTLGSGYELVVITTKDQLERGSGGVGGFLRDGTPIPLHIARMLACDSARIDVTLGEHGEVLDVGRSTRTIPSAIARALWLRDGGCRAPGCGRRRHLHAHHIQAWAEGGPTSLANLVLVCPGHHRKIHEGLLAAEVRDAKIVFRDQRGRDMPAAPASAASGHDLAELELFLRDADVHIDEHTNAPRWDGTRMNLAEALDWLLMMGDPPTRRSD